MRGGRLRADRRSRSQNCGTEGSPPRSGPGTLTKGFLLGSSLFSGLPLKEGSWLLQRLMPPLSVVPIPSPLPGEEERPGILNKDISN